MHAKLKQIIRINKAQPLLDQVFFFWYKIRLCCCCLPLQNPCGRPCIAILYYILSSASIVFLVDQNAGKVIRLTLYWNVNCCLLFKLLVERLYVRVKPPKLSTCFHFLTCRRRIIDIVALCVLIPDQHALCHGYRPVAVIREMLQPPLRLHLQLLPPRHPINDFSLPLEQQHQALRRYVNYLTIKQWEYRVGFNKTGYDFFAEPFGKISKAGAV